ncbi:MAG: hypothetical protein ACTSU4_02625 [Promethearchaeota archaeon]
MDLKDLLNKIEERENEVAALETKIERLMELIERQKKIIQEQEKIIEEQKQEKAQAIEVPEDVRELKEIIGMQRALLNEKELELEHAKGEALQAKKEMELYKQQRETSDQKLTETLKQVGELKAKLAEKEGELLVKNDRIKSLENQIQEIKSFEGKYKEEYTREIEALRNEYRTEIENLTKKYAEEKQQLQSKLTKLETFLLESEIMTIGDKEIEALDFEEKFKEIYDKQKELISKIEQLTKEKAEALKQVSEMENKIKDIENNYKKKFEEIKEQTTALQEYEKLKPLMEQEGIFKAYFIIKDVGQISIDDLRNAVGSPIVLIRKMVDQLKQIGLVEENEEGKIAAVKFSGDLPFNSFS